MPSGDPAEDVVAKMVFGEIATVDWWLAVRRPLDKTARAVGFQFSGTQLDTPGVYDFTARLTVPDGVETAPTEGGASSW